MSSEPKARRSPRIYVTTTEEVLNWIKEQSKRTGAPEATIASQLLYAGYQVKKDKGLP